MAGAGWLRGQMARGELGEGCRKSVLGFGVDAEFVVSAAEILDEGVPGSDDLGGAETFQSPHRPQSGLQPAVIGLDLVVGIPGVDVVGGGQLFVEDPRVGRGAVGGHLGRAPPWDRARVKNRRAAAGSRFSEARTSMTWPNWSIAR